MKRPTIGLLVSRLENGYQTPIWHGVSQVAVAHDINLLCIAGGMWRGLSSGEKQANFLYNQIGTHNLDGLLIITASVGVDIDTDEIREFCLRYAPLPTVSIGLALAGIPSVTVDNAPGMRKAVAHLIEHHHKQRIAFIRGPEGHLEAEIRYAAYRETLQDYGISFAPELVVPGDFRDAIPGLRVLLNERQVTFDALVAANDSMAYTALAFLKNIGKRIPDDIAVIGFDDVDWVEFISPALTTVHQPIQQLGQRSAETLLALMDGQVVPETQILPTSLVIRQSCGCWIQEVMEAYVPLVNEPPLIAIDSCEPVPFCSGKNFCRTVIAVMPTVNTELASKWVQSLCRAMRLELFDEKSHEFLATFNNTLQQTIANNIAPNVWQRALSAVRRYFLSLLGTEDRVKRQQAENLLHQARMMVGEAIYRTQAYHQVELKEHARFLREIGQTLLNAVDMPELLRVIADTLPQMDIPCAYLALYTSAPTKQLVNARANIVLAYDKNGPITLPQSTQQLPTSTLLPATILPTETRYSLVVEPLYFQDEYLGWISLEAGLLDGMEYDALREQLSNAIRGALLLRARQQAEQALSEAYAEVESQVAQRTTDLMNEIAEHQRAVSALRESENRFRNTVAHIQDGILILEQGQAVYANARLSEILGLPTAKISLTSLFEAATEEALPFVDPVQKHYAKTGQLPESLEYWIKRPNDESRYIYCRYSAQPQTDGQLYYYIAITDITARKQAEQQLAGRLASLTHPVMDTSDLKFEDLFDIDEIQKIQDAFAKASGVASIITDTKGEPLTKASNFCRLCNNIIRATDKGFANCKQSDAILGQDHGGRPMMRPCLSGGLWDGGAPILVGKRQIANWLVGQVRNEQLDYEQMLAYARDIGADEAEFAEALEEVPEMSTEQFQEVCNALYLIANQLSEMALQNVQQAREIAARQRAEAETLRLQHLLQNITNSMPSALITLDAVGRVLAWNPAAAKLINVPFEQVVGRVLKVLPSLLARYHDMVLDVIAQQTLAERQRDVWLTADGESYYNIVVFPLSVDFAAGAVLRMDDVTHQVQLETMMLQAAKMASIGGLAAGIAHEINTPLSAMMQSAQLLQIALDTERPRTHQRLEQHGVDPEALARYVNARGLREYLQGIRTIGARAGKIVSDLLVFSRKGTADRSTHDLSDLIYQTLELALADYDLKKKYDFRNIQQQLVLAKNLPVILCDGQQIQQVILNLVRNAAQAMAQKRATATTDYQPRLIIRTRFDSDANVVRLEVEDNGPGVPENRRTQLFTPFFTTKGVGEGTGLGLWVCWSIVVENHGGQIWAETVPEGGERFVVALPVE